MYSEFLFDGEGSHRVSKMSFFRGIALGFGAGLLIATVVTMALVPPTTDEPSSLIASPFSMAQQNSVAPPRGAIVAQGLRGNRDGGFHARQGNTRVTENSGNTGVVEQTSTLLQNTPVQTASVANFQGFSDEQLESFRSNRGAIAYVELFPEPMTAQTTYAQPDRQPDYSGYSEEQLAFLQRAGKLPQQASTVAAEQSQQSTNADEHYTKGQLEFLRKKIEEQYQQPAAFAQMTSAETASVGAPAIEPVAQARSRGGYHKKRFS